MPTIREHTDIDECRRIWDSVWPKQCLFDLWDVRACFAEAFDRPARFLVAEQDRKAVGLLPLSWIDEEGCFSSFPGETWNGKTWLEQNKIPSISAAVRNELLASVHGPLHLRYLDPQYIAGEGLDFEPDETGYLFLPGQHAFSFERFMESLSRKFRKNCARELSRLEVLGISYRYGHLPDVPLLFRMSLEAFGESSYFSDPRFLASFEGLVAWLWDNGMLSITTVLIGGSVAAVDIGAAWGRSHTVLAGGTNPDFRGVAKIINFHHIQRACIERLETVDFLCGDFGWKERFQLSPRPLYKISSITGRRGEPRRLEPEVNVSSVS